MAYQSLSYQLLESYFIDETHFLFKCKLHDSIRSHYILLHGYYKMHLYIFKTEQLLNSSNALIMRNPSLFIHKVVIL